MVSALVSANPLLEGKSRGFPQGNDRMFAIISDIHGNLEALSVVLADIQKRGITEILCLGDVVGYGPNPA